MNRSLGILIPSEALEDDEIYNFCKLYIEQGIFQELKIEKIVNIQRKQKGVKLADLSADRLDLECTRLDIPKMYATIARAFWSMFYVRSSTKTLLNADVLDWSKTVRLIIEVDKRDIKRMFKHFKWMETLDKGDKNRFWLETIDSVSGIRKHWDKIEKQWYLSEPKKEVKPYAPGF